MRDLSGLSPWAEQLATTLVSLSSDIALVIDRDGVIKTVAQNRAEPMTPAAAHWIGQAWVDTVSGETKRKIELLLDEVSRTGLAKRREVNHTATGGPGIPVAYTAVRLGQDGPVLAVGRDLRAIAAIHQRFVESQQELERVYWQTRQDEARDQRLLQVFTDAVLVVDARSLKIRQCNHASQRALARSNEALLGQTMGALFDAHTRGAVEELLAAALGTGRPGELRARLARQHVAINVAATPFLRGKEQMLLLRLRDTEPARTGTGAAPSVAQALASASVAIADSGGRLMSCSGGLCALLGAANEAQLKGQHVAAWGLPDDTQWPALVARVRQDGLATATPMVIRRTDSTETQVLVTGSLLAEGDQECIGLAFEPVLQVPGSPAPEHHAVMALLAQIDMPLGSAALPALLQRINLLAEQQLIERAIEQSAGDLQSAASLLGLSREALDERMNQRPASTAPAATPN